MYPLLYPMILRPLVFVLCLCAAFACAAPTVAQKSVTITTQPATAVLPASADRLELYRLRFVNQTSGPIQVSDNQGASWVTIGHVLSPATTAVEGFTAAQYAPPGSVAAISMHGIRIRIGDDDPTLHDPLIISIDPVEYASPAAQDPQKGFGGQISGSAGIITDIHAGSSIFRGLSPLVGNIVYRENSSRELVSLTSAFRPKGSGEVLVIPVFAPRNGVSEITLENRVGGKVAVVFYDGDVKTITRVVQPVMGIGRFDGTSYSGVGSVNTNHTGVITISSAPVVRDGVAEGNGREKRGGFQICPVWHSRRLEESGSGILLTVGNVGSDGIPAKPVRDLEATAPLFMGYLPLGDAPTASAAAPTTTKDAQRTTDAFRKNQEDSFAVATEGRAAPAADTPAPDNGNTSTEMRVDDAEWEPLPSLVGSLPDVFTGDGLTRYFRRSGINRSSTKGVTAFRIRFPHRSAARSHRAIALASGEYQRNRYLVAKANNTPVVRGTLTVNANPTNARNVSFVRLMVEGNVVAFTNVAPFTLSWNTRLMPDGDYTIEAAAMDGSGAILATTRKQIYVSNGSPGGSP